MIVLKLLDKIRRHSRHKTALKATSIIHASYYSTGRHQIIIEVQCTDVIIKRRCAPSYDLNEEYIFDLVSVARVHRLIIFCLF